MKEMICIILGVGLVLGVTWDGTNYKLRYSQERGGHILVNDGK